MENTFYHAHVTIPNDIVVANSRGWKRTEIYYGNIAKQVHDVMYTRHFMANTSRELTSFYRECQEFSRVNRGIRIKIEKDNNFEKLSDLHYLECHCKCEGDPGKDMDGWVRSRNPRELDPMGNPVFFWNKRVRTGDPYKEIEQIRGEIAKFTCRVLEIKFEQLEYDSTMGHDDWWA